MKTLKQLLLKLICLLCVSTANAQFIGPYEMISDRNDRPKYGLTDFNGRVTFEPGEIVNPAVLYNNYRTTLFRLTDTTNWLEGMINKKKQIICKPVWQKIEYFEYDIARVITDAKTPIYMAIHTSYTDGLIGAIDTLGKVVIPIKYSFISHFTDSVAVFTTSKYSQALRNDENTIDPVHPYVGKFGLINTKGEIIVPEIYDYISPFIRDTSANYYTVRKDGLYGGINTKGEIVVDIDMPTFDAAWAKRCKNEKTEIISPPEQTSLLDTLDLLQSTKWKAERYPDIVMCRTFESRTIKSEISYSDKTIQINAIYYLSDTPDSVFNKKMVGKVQNGKYIICRETPRPKDDHFTVYEICTITENNLYLRLFLEDYNTNQTMVFYTRQQ